jgi:hypothetical protein
VANVPARAATAHSITVPLRRYESHGLFTKEGTDGALFPVRFDTSGERLLSDEKSERKRWRFIIRRNPVLLKNKSVPFFHERRRY